MTEGEAAAAVQCPTCGKRFKALRSNLGKRAKCSCGVAFELREAPPSPAPAAPPVDAAPAPSVPPVAAPPPPAAQASPEPAAAAPSVPAVEPIVQCPHHPAVVANCKCTMCGAQICQACTETSANGTVTCRRCSTMAPWERPTVVAAAPITGKCRQHPQSQAVRLCATCGAPVCATCDFAFPGDVHLCPICATEVPQTVSGRRKGRAIWAIGLAVWGTMALVVLLAVAPQMEPRQAEALGILSTYVGLIPTLIGLGIGVASFERRMANPPIVGVGAVWNGVLMAGWLLIIVIGVST